MAEWLRELRRHTFLATITVFSLASTILTFVPVLGLGQLRLVALVSLIVSFAWANYLVYRKQAKEILELRDSQTSNSEKRARLVIHQRDGSRWIAAKASQGATKFDATYVEFWLAVENKGSRHSTITRCGVDIPALSACFEDAKPFHMSSVLGRKSNYGIWQQGNLMANGQLVVDAEKMSSPGNLPFRLSVEPPPIGIELECILTLYDTEGRFASHTFQIPSEEAK
jgi:hypothetical protein